jgi:hypothetical protein
MERLMEARRRVSKARALKPIQEEVEAAMEKGWKAQARITLKGFEKMQRVWPVKEALTPGPSPKMGEGKRAQAPTGMLLEAVGEGEVDDIFEKAAEETFELFDEPLTAAAAQALESGAAALIGKLGVKISFDLKNPRAVKYLKEYGAQLVKQINETTRLDLRTTVGYGLEHGWSYTKTARAIQERFKGYYEPGSWWNFDAPRPQEHIASRAHLIAVTESGNAYEAGNYAAAEDLADAGIQIEKQWSTMGDDKVSEGCRENEAEGWIPYDQAHKSGDQHPLRFPGCRCDEEYRVRD